MDRHRGKNSSKASIDSNQCIVRSGGSSTSGPPELDSRGLQPIPRGARMLCLVAQAVLAAQKGRAGGRTGRGSSAGQG